MQVCIYRTLGIVCDTCNRRDYTRHSGPARPCAIPRAGGSCLFLPSPRDERPGDKYFGVCVVLLRVVTGARPSSSGSPVHNATRYARHCASSLSPPSPPSLAATGRGPLINRESRVSTSARAAFPPRFRRGTLLELRGREWFFLSLLPP